MDFLQDLLDDLVDGVSLGQLSIPDIDFGDVRGRLAEQEKILKKFEDEYGKEDGWTKYLEYRNGGPLYNTLNKFFNTVIYKGSYCYARGNTPDATRKMNELWKSRKQAVFGSDYDTTSYESGDPYVCELLLADAIRTGKWRELPDELQDEYHNRVDDY